MHFNEALEELTRIIQELSEIDEEDLKVAVSHLYHHLNTGWNIRNFEVDPDSDESFYELRRMPADIALDLEE